MKKLRSVIFRKLDNIKDEYDFVNKRANGAYHVYRRKSDDQNVCIKKIKSDESYNVVSLLMLNNGDSMIKCFDSVECEGDQWVVLELMADNLNGLIKYLQNFHDDHNESLIAYAVWSILKGLNFLHDRGQVYQWLSSYNVLYNYDA